LLNDIRNTQIAKELEDKGYNLLTEVYPLNRDEARGFRPIYLDICLDAIVVYDRNSFFRRILASLKRTLHKLGSVRMKLPDGNWIWLLKPGLRFGEEFGIDIQ